MRTNLIMHLHCSECGSVLRLKYDEETKARPVSYSSVFGENDEEPTGSSVRYIPAVMVEPCRACIDRYTGPAKKLASAIAALTLPTPPTEI